MWDKKGRVENYLSGALRGLVTGILVLLQFAIIFALSYLLSGYGIYINLFFQITAIIITIRLLNDTGSASYRTAWICIILVIPIAGLFMYLLWGRSGAKKIEKNIRSRMNHGFSFMEFSEDKLKRLENEYPTKLRLAKEMESWNFALAENNKITYYPMGEDVFEDICAELEKAKKFILIHFFIVAEGALWDRIHEILLRKVAEGVEVKFLYDDFGAMLRTDKDFQKKLEEEHIETRVFNPIHKYTHKLYMNYRSHHKIVVIDGNIGYTGGMNIADEYVNVVSRFGVWKDNAVRIDGEGVWGLTVIFLQMWNITGGTEVLDYNPYRPNKNVVSGKAFCQIISDGPANNPNNPVESAYRSLIYSANKYLYITTPYLVLEDDMKDALRSAKASGIDVRIITPKIPDKKLVNLITKFNYGALLKEGIRIYEYTPGFIHAKTIITDECGIVGTINMDYRSFYLHYEGGAFIYDREEMDIIKNDLLATMEVSEEIHYEDWLKRPLSMKLKQNVLNLFATLM